MQLSTCAAVFRPVEKRDALLYDIMLVIGASIAMALSAQVAVPVPFSPVPITMQTLAVLLTGALLGSRLGSLAVIAYLLEGIAGLPVYANAHAGFIHLIGPTGGYLFGFIPAAYLTGFLAERHGRTSWWITMLIMTAGTGVIFTVGLSWLALIVPGPGLLEIGFYPYLPGALIKIIIASLVFMSGWRLVELKKSL